MKSEKFILLFFIITACFFISSCNHKKYSEKKLTCKTKVYSDNFIAGFPVHDPKQKKWGWNRAENEAPFDYTWIVEPGNMKNGAFEPSKYAFGHGHLNTSHGENYGVISEKETYGTISGLIASMKNLSSDVYLNDPDPKRRNKAADEIGHLPVHIGQYDNRLVLLTSTSLPAIKILFLDRPEYARMTMKTPYPAQSYVCMVKIEYNNGPGLNNNSD
jgi:hypothetical protein